MEGTIEVPERIRRMAAGDLEGVNHLFSVAFTESYHRDGHSTMSIPPLHPDFLRLEWKVAGSGAFSLEIGGVVRGFVLARAHGSEGWFGPLAVDPNVQGKGYGKALVKRAVSYLKRKGCTTIGLETMPRTYRNLGLYARLGFCPGHLVLTVKAEIPRTGIRRVNTPRPVSLLSTAEPSRRARILGAIQRFCGGISAGVDYTAEIEATLAHSFGDLLYLSGEDPPSGFVFFHHSPYFVSDGYGVLRVARLGAARGTGAFASLMYGLARYGQERSMEEIYIRAQTSDWEVTSALLGWGFRIVHSDLRLSLEGYPERVAADRIHLSRWG